jgi:hypothetical protein
MALACVLGGGLLVDLGATPGRWAAAVDHIERLHVAAAGELAARAGPGARVAVFDVGAAAYARPCPLLDLSGLTGGAELAAMADGRADRLLRARGATHVLLPRWGEPEDARSLRARLGLLAPQDVSLDLVHAWSYPRERWWPQFQFTGNAFPELRLYAVRPVR